MKNTMIFTSTINPHLLSWVHNYAKKMKTTKRNILEEAIKYYQTEVERRELAATFKRAAKDPEMQAMAEEGFGDYIDQLKSLGI